MTVPYHDPYAQDRSPCTKTAREIRISAALSRSRTLADGAAVLASHAQTEPKRTGAARCALGTARLQPGEFAHRIAAGALVVDCQAPEAFAGAHIPGALNVGAGTSFFAWAGSILPEAADVLLVVDDPGQLRDIYW
jgi:hypothetical protein